MVEWIAIVYDVPNSARLKVRAEHMAAIPLNVASGKITNAGGIFEKVNEETGKPENFIGSSFNIVADTKEEALEFLKQDVYCKEGVWDMNSVIIHPYGCAVRIGKEFPQ